VSTRNLDSIFRPNRVAIVGASDRADSVGHAVLRNMLGSGFGGVVYPVNVKREAVQGVAAYKGLEHLPQLPDLAVICTPAPTVPALVEQCAEMGVGGVVILSAGFREAGAEGKALEQRVIEAQRKRPDMRIVGPNCLGVIVPGLGLNASFTVTSPGDGRLAFISQSGALGTSILDWATTKRIGISHFVSVGNMIDVNFADLIDYFGQHEHTSGILLYIESILHARPFLSAARAYTRSQPIIAYKAGRFAASAEAAASHTGAMVGADDVHDAAFKRVGIERVYAIDDLFDCAELLGRQVPPKQGRLGVVTNAGGPGVMAADALIARGGALAELNPPTVEALNDVLPPAWSHGNPVDVLGDATPTRYADAARLVLADHNVDAMLVILTPQAMTDPTAVAHAIADAAKKTSKLVLCAWLGGDSVQRGREVLERAGVPAYASPEQAIRGLRHLISYAHNIQTLYETPRELPVDLPNERDRRRAIKQEVLGEAGVTVSEGDAKRLLKAYGIPVSETVAAGSADQAVKVAGQIGYPVVLKVRSPQITHKTDVSGVMLDLVNGDEVRQAYETIVRTAERLRPDADVQGVTVQPMIDTKHAVELIVGVKKDPVFGSVIMVGIGGVEAEVWKDNVLALPPLTEALTTNMLEQLKSWPLLTGYRGRPKVDIDQLSAVLIKLSYMVAHCPNIAELDINPLIVGPEQVIAADGRIMTDDAPVERDQHYSHLAIRPYPGDLERRIVLENGERVLLRPIRPEDEPMWHAMLGRCSAASLRARFFSTIRETTHEMATRYCFIDYDREMAIVGIVDDPDTPEEDRRMIGVGRLVADPNHESAEYAILVEDAYQNRKVGTELTSYCLEIAKGWGVQRVNAATSLDNRRMIATFQDQGFELSRDFDEGLVFAERGV